MLIQIDCPNACRSQFKIQIDMPTALLIAILIKIAEMWRRSEIENSEAETQESRSQVDRIVDWQISVQTSETNYQYQGFNDQLSTQEQEMPQDKIMMILQEIQLDIRHIKKVIEQINSRLDRHDEQISMVNTRLFTIQQHLVNRNQGFIPYTNEIESSSNPRSMVPMSSPSNKKKFDRFSPIYLEQRLSPSKLKSSNCTFQRIQEHWKIWTKSVWSILIICCKSKLTLKQCSDIINFFLFLGPENLAYQTKIISAIIVLKENFSTDQNIDIRSQCFQGNNIISPPLKEEIQKKVNPLKKQYLEFYNRGESEIEKALLNIKGKSQKAPKLPRKEQDEIKDCNQEIYYMISMYLLQKQMTKDGIKFMVDAMYSELKESDSTTLRKLQKLNYYKKKVMKMFPK